jgi:xylulokinase
VRVEQNPEDWRKATAQVFRQLLKQPIVKASEIEGLAPTGQMHGLVRLDKHGNVLRPCILWNNQRTQA